MHCVPHPPQFEFVWRLVSQPVAYERSQSAKPGLHDEIAHMPLLHAAVPFAAKHTTPHAPQLFGSELSVASHPLAALPSQSPLPAKHTATPQLPFTQVGEPPIAGHAWPHDPQFCTFVFVLISQPFAAFISQSAKPPLHAIEHFAELHVGVPLFVLHTAPHDPQSSLSVWRFDSQPFVGSPSQSANVPLHDWTAHAPPEHIAFAFVSEHACPHMPQWKTSVCVFVSQPSPGIRLHSANGAAHAPSAQLPALQTGAAFAYEQTMPH